MARLGVTYAEIADAATQLTGQNLPPTIERIRSILGTGSSTTIANHLKQWKEAQESTGNARKENLPQELVAIVKGLWERIANQTEIETSALQEAHQATVSDLQEELQKYKTNNQRWQKLYDQWMAEKNKLDDDKLTLEQALNFSQKENHSLQTKQDALLQQLQDKQDRIAELNHLHQQTQSNLEHYRESVLAQQLLDQQQHEKEINALQANIKTMGDKTSRQDEKILTLQQENQSIKTSYTNSEKNLALAQAEINSLMINIEKIENAKNSIDLEYKHLQNKNEDLSKTINEKSQHLTDSQAECKLLSTQLSHINQIVSDLRSHLKLLENEKWTLAQEKAQLEGQLKQIQEMIPA